MRIRRFTGPDTATALRRVKEALGSEAVILQTSSRREGGVEITAAVDAELVTRTLAPSAAAATPELANLARELHELGLHVRALDRAVRPPAPGLTALGPEALALAERLALQGLAIDLAAPIAATFESARNEGAAAVTALEDSLARHLTSAPRTARVTAFIGPTGAGKTTTIAKLAARDVGTAGRRVGLIMADGIRVGAREQLETYARLLDVPMQVARDGDELQAALAGFADRDAVYVDTAGLGGDQQETLALERLLAIAGEPVARTAVVSAGSSDAALRAAWRQLGAMAPESCVVTKVDEGAGLGPACSWLHERGLALAWLGIGQRVPEDLTAPSGGELARWLVAA